MAFSIGLSEKELEVLVNYNIVSKSQDNLSQSLTNLSQEGQNCWTTTSSSGGYWNPVSFQEMQELQKRQSIMEQSCKNNYPKFKPKKTIMQKLSSMARSILDPDTQTLVKAGYLNEDLSLSDTGRYRLMAMSFAANKAALVVEAQKDLDEAKSVK